MKYYAKYVFSLFLIISLSIGWHSALGQLKIGDKLPKEQLEKVKSVTSTDFPEKLGATHLYLLDFWNLRCGTCIGNFSEMEGLQFQFRNHIKIVALNPWDNDKHVTDYFARFSSDELTNKGTDYRMTTLPAINGDKSWLDLFPTKTVPHHVWLDSEGMVLAITGHYNAIPENVAYYLITGELPRMLFKAPIGKFDLPAHSLQSLLDKDALPYHHNYMWARGLYEGVGGEIGGYGYNECGVIDSVNNTIRYSFVNTPIIDLYKFAWWGLRPEYWRTFYTFQGWPVGQHYEVPDNRVLWNVNDPQFYMFPFEYNTKETHGYDAWALRAKFCVEFVLPLEQKENIPHLIMEGLNHYFSQKLGVTARIDTCKRYCLVLKKERLYKSLRSVGVKIIKERDEAKHLNKFTNYAFENILLDILPYKYNYKERYPDGILISRLPIIDETGISGNVDINLHDVPEGITDPVEALNIRLKGTGLYVEKEVRNIEMLVITDEVIEGMNN